jgi:hypothetical protein
MIIFTTIMDFENKIIIIQHLSTWKGFIVIGQPHYDNLS